MKETLDRSINDSPEQRRLEAADGGGRSGVAQIWQHFLRDVLLEKLQ